MVDEFEADVIPAPMVAVEVVAAPEVPASVEVAPQPAAPQPVAPQAAAFAPKPAARRGRPPKVIAEVAASVAPPVKAAKAKLAPAKAPKAKVSNANAKIIKLNTVKPKLVEPKIVKAKPAALIAAVPKPTTIKAKSAAPKTKPITPISAPISPSATTFLKEFTMTTFPSFDLTTIKTAFTDMQDKAKAAYEKNTASFANFGEYGDFAKGNVEAMVEAGKILASGLQSMGSGIVADGRGAFEALTAEAKDVAAVKSPTDFFKLQGELATKHFDAMVAFGSKQSDAMMKLAGEVAAPISGRVSIAVEKAKIAA